MSACKWSIKWKTWQFSFRGHSGMAGGGQPDWNSSTITWKSTQGRQPWQTKTAQRPHAVTLPGASGATGPPKPRDRTGQIRAEVSQRYCLHQKHKGTTRKTCGSSTGLDGVRIHFMISSYCSGFKSDSQQFLLKSNMLLLSLHITKI